MEGLQIPQIRPGSVLEITGESLLHDIFVDIDFAREGAVPHFDLVEHGGIERHLGRIIPGAVNVPHEAAAGSIRRAAQRMRRRAGKSIEHDPIHRGKCRRILRKIIALIIDIGLGFQVGTGFPDRLDETFDERIPAVLPFQLTAARALTEIASVGSTHVYMPDLGRDFVQPGFGAGFERIQRTRSETAGEGFAFQFFSEEAPVLPAGQKIFFPVGKTVKGPGSESHQSDLHAGFGAFFQDQFAVTFPAVVIMDDDRIEIELFHPPDKSSQLLRRMPQQAFAGIESADGE